MISKVIMKRKEEVNQLIIKAEQDIKKIEDEYNKSLHSKNIDYSLKIDIKRFIETIRSALEYSAHDIYEQLILPDITKRGKSEIKKIYFPYGKDKAQFEGYLSSMFPNIKVINLEIYSIIESMQPHISGKTWLLDLFELVDTNKHDSLTPQKRIESKRLNISSGGASMSIGEGASISMGSGASISLGGKRIMGGQTINANSDIIYGDSGLDVRKEIWVSFQFTGTQINVLPFLKESLNNIKIKTSEIYTKLEK